MHGRFDTRAWLRSIAVLMLVTTTLVVPVTSASAETTVTLTGAQANEGDSGSSTFTFSLSVTGGFAGTIEGTYRTRGAGEPTPGPDPATATPGVDYRSTSGTFSFTASGDEQLIDVTVFGDKEIEPHEIFYIEVRSDRLEGGLTSIGRILNDDIRSISINDVTVVEGDTGSPTVEFTVRLSHVSTETVTFQYATCGNYCDGEATAVEHSDFKADTGTLTIEPGRVIRKLRVALIADTELEPDETFFVIIFNPVNAALGDREGVGTIVNDDTEAPTRLALATTAIFEGDSGTTSAVFTVSASPAPTEMVTVEFTPCGVGCSVDATASPGDDFIHAWQTITFQPGQTVKTVSVAVVGDKVAEEDEVFFGYLLNPVNARVDVNKAVVTILDDDTPNRPPACGGKRATLWGEGLLVGTAGDDVIVGGPGSDELKGLGGDDTLCGGGGDDTLVGGPGHDTMFGDAGNDLIKGLVGDDVAYGGPGDDRIQGNSGRDKLSGGDGKDKLWGGIHNDRLDGGADNDQLRGGAGSDTLIGGPGTDRSWGDAANDIIDGGDNSDVLYGGIGADMIWGGKGNDRIFGWDGNDLLFGGPGRDQLRGQTGDDLVDGGASNDFCSEESTMVSCEQIL